jgi:hypothetical protein
MAHPGPFHLAFSPSHHELKFILAVDGFASTVMGLARHLLQCEQYYVPESPGVSASRGAGLRLQLRSLLKELAELT